MPLTRSTVARRARNENSQTTPIYRLPNELIVEIFKHLPKARWARHKFLSSISGTSSLWRHIALHTRFLWTTITLYPSCPDRPCSTKPRFFGALDMVHLYLERVGLSIPIDLWLDFRVPPSIFNDNLVVPLLVHNIHRCESLTIQAHGYSIFRVFPPTVSVHLLRNLELRLDGSYPALHTPTRLFQCSSELHLHSLSVWGCPQSTWPNVHWERLSHLTLFSAKTTSSHFETVLRRCTNLISLQCDLSLIEVTPGLGHIELPRLTLLDMGTVALVPLSLIHAPQLLHLHIREVPTLPATLPLLNPEISHFPLLRTIAFSQSSNWVRFLPGFLDTCPNLTALELLAREPIADILKELALNPLATSSETNVLRNPSLVHIRLRIPRTGTSTVFRKTTWKCLERILHQRPQVSLEFEDTSSFTNGLKDLSSVFPGRVRAVGDFAKEPPLSDLF